MDATGDRPLFLKGFEMLVLSRRAGQQILIGDDIVISVVRLGPNTVKLGIDCPKEISILRAEVKEADGKGPMADGQTGTQEAS